MNEVSTSLNNSIQLIGAQLATFLPRLIAALVVLIIGLLVSAAIGELVKRLIGYTRLDRFWAETALYQRMRDRNLNFSFANLFGGIVRWFFYILTFVIMADVLQVPQLTQFLIGIAYYIPNVIIAVIIVAAALIISRFVYSIILDSLQASRFTAGAARVLAVIARSAIIIFAAMAALLQLGIAPGLLQILFAGLVVMFALAGGIAFGLGGKDRAADLLDETRNRMTRRQAGGRA